jgi:hypothetical protein
MVKKSTARHRHEQERKKEVKQASVLLSIVGVVGLTAVVIAGQITKADIPLIVYGIFAGTILPPEYVKKFFKALGKD